MKNGAMRNRYFTAMLAAVACASWGSGVASGQIFQPTIPDFEPAVVFETGVGSPYGLDSADFLKQDENGNWVPGQDGLPEIAVAGAGVSLFWYCTDDTGNHSITVFRNTGSWDTDPANALEIHQDDMIIPAFDGGTGLNISAAELGFADVTGINGPDLVLLGSNTDYDIGYLLVYQNLGNGFFDTTPYITATPATTLRGLVTADFDLDGDIDIIAAASECDASGADRDFVMIFENVSTQDGIEFVVHPITLGIPNDFPSGDIVMGDFYPLSPGMPLLDLVTSNPRSSSITKLANLGLLQFDANTATTPTGCSPAWGFVTAASGQFGADVHWDFAGVVEENLVAAVFRGQGLGSFESYCDNPSLAYQLYPSDDGVFLFAHGIASGRLNADAYPDLIVAIRNYDAQLINTEWSGAVAVLLGLPDGSFKAQNTGYAYIFSTMDGYGVANVAGAALLEVVDLNADGFDDIVVSNNESGNVPEGAPDNISVLINKMLESVGP